MLTKCNVSHAFCSLSHLKIINQDIQLQYRINSWTALLLSHFYKKKGLYSAWLTFRSVMPHWYSHCGQQRWHLKTWISLKMTFYIIQEDISYINTHQFMSHNFFVYKRSWSYTKFCFQESLPTGRPGSCISHKIPCFLYLNWGRPPEYFYLIAEVTIN